MKAVSMYLVVVVVFGSLVCQALGGVWGSKVPEDPSHPNQCHDSATGLYHAVGASWRRPDKCEGLSCRAGDEPGFLAIRGTSCSYATRLPSNCRMTPEKAGVEYPACCPKLECDGEPQGSISMVG